MSLLFKGPRGSVEQRWIVYALLRDNVQHYLEGGTPTEEFASVHGITEALGGKAVTVGAQALRRELVRAREEISDRPVSELAVSVRTLAVINLLWPPPEKRETMLLSACGRDIPFIDITGGKTMNDVFGLLLDELIQITKNASIDDIVEIVDM